MLEMSGTRTWFSGRATCLPYLAMVLGRRGDWSMHPTRANGQPAAFAEWHGERFGVAVLGLRAGGLARISLFTDPEVVARFAALS
jgi:RNA polymerase sigma-70 factor (ECF subfamily)